MKRIEIYVIAVLIAISSISTNINAQEMGEFTDGRDGKTYKTVTIGDQTWMAENLNYKTNDSWCYDNNSSNCNKYGRLYNWDAAKNACPSGWHLPSDNEWKQLEMTLGMSQSEANDSGGRGTNEGGKMKETRIGSWPSPNAGATNSSGFTAIPGGYRSSTSSYEFNAIDRDGNWWSSSEVSRTIAWYRYLNYHIDQVGRAGDCRKADGLSVRCLKN